jgi:dihydroorotate dehydrogenase electron transfer subunit
MHLGPAQIEKNSRIAPRVFFLVLADPRTAKTAKPGQFLMVRVRDGVDPLLRRPLSIHDVEEGGRVCLLYRVEGKGTEVLSRARPGESLSVLGPLGNGFQVRTAMARHILVGGGMGIAPLLHLARVGAEKGAFTPESCTVFLGGRTADEIYSEERFRDLPVDLRTATDDGSRGTRGTVVDLLEERLEEGGDDASLYACGPPAMIRALGERVAGRPGIRAQVSLEERMACGLGACRGCAIPVRSPDATVRMAAVCTEGPVFDLRVLETASP